PTRYVCDTKTWGGPSVVRRLTRAEYANAIRDVFALDGSTRYPGAYGAAATGFSTEPGIGIVGEQGVEQLLYAGEDVALALSPKIATLVTCAATGTVACATTFLDTYGRRAFRRALTGPERTALLAIYSAERADNATFADAVSVMSAALLQMPAFLYVVEAPAAVGVDRLRTGLELATQLSLYLWGSVPDEVLLTAAESGQLTTKAQVLAQAQRMFADPKADRAFARFVREWTQTPALLLADKDPAAFPWLNQTLVDSINGSFDRFASAQLRTGASLRTLLRTSEAYVDAPLAAFFGVTPPASGWAKVTLDPTRYTGLMTQPASMAALAHSSETSYVFRGRVVRTRLMCENLGTPPPNAATTFASLPKPPDPTARDLSAAVQSNPGCAGCHKLLDPAGIALEHFDAMGKYRQAYASGKAIDPSGSLVSSSSAPLPFAGPTELFEGIASLQKTSDCLAQQVFRYTASRTETASDNCALQQLRDALADSGNRLDKVFLASTQTDAFMYRRGE
ncbi:MAG: Cellulose-binding domain protein, partial [Myxococcaceae bacterium]|nr:Cellulose-binding domain protein [Myxococcaceae bacterium]